MVVSFIQPHKREAIDLALSLAQKGRTLMIDLTGNRLGKDLGSQAPENSVASLFVDKFANLQEICKAITQTRYRDLEYAELREDPDKLGGQIKGEEGNLAGNLLALNYYAILFIVPKTANKMFNRALEIPTDLLMDAGDFETAPEGDKKAYAFA
jgi:hypothetical protein